MADRIRELLQRGPFLCVCGRRHAARLKDAIIEKDAILRTPEALKALGGTRAFILADENTFAAAGEKLTGALRRGGIPYTLFRYPAARTEPDEAAAGAAMLHFDTACDALVALGSGVINDITKIVARMTGLPFVCVGTAPSMDGYASSTSSVVRQGLKVSVDSRCPDVFIGDLDVLCATPEEMLLAGLGDMLAKYISVCEWRIGRIVTGEYYCEEVAALIRGALRLCRENAEGLKKREPAAVRAVTEGLILSGVAADWAGVSRPVSGVEHYFSHIWDMRALEFGMPFALHGIQCGVGTLYALRGYEALQKLQPDPARARRAAERFDEAAWFATLRGYLGRAAEPMIEAELREHRNDPAARIARAETIAARWEEILTVVRKELPPAEEVRVLLERLGAPVSPVQLGLPESDVPLIFQATRDVRNKYILSALCFDLGCAEEVAAAL